jgi:cysteine desulfurase
MKVDFAIRPKEIYLDNAATTVVDDAVVEAMQSFTEEKYGNPETPYHLGQEAKSAIENARMQVAELLGGDPSEIYFTSCGTEANNWALKGVNYQIAKGLIVSAVEHPSILQPANWLGKSRKVTILPVDSLGRVDLNALEKELQSGSVALVSIQYANNEVGTIQPVKEIAELCKKCGVLYHCDMVQAFGKVPEKVSDFAPDLVTLSSHKIHGPMGVGALYVKTGTVIEPLLHGGGQERGLRSGTHAVSQIVGFGKACEICWSGMSKEMTRLRKMVDSLFAELRVKTDAVRNGDPKNCLPHILNITIPNVEASVVAGILNRYGICVATGAACHTNQRGSHVLTAMGKSSLACRSTLRISLSRLNRETEITHFIAYLQTALKELNVRSVI